MPLETDFVLRCEITGHTADVRSLVEVETSGDSTLLLSGSSDCSARIWQEKRPNEFATPVPPVPLPHHIHSVEYFTTETGDVRVIVGDRKGAIRIFSVTPWQEIVVLSEHTKAVCCLKYDRIHKCLLSGSWDHSIRMWKGEGFRDMTVLSSQQGPVWCVAIVPDDKDTSRDEPAVLYGSADKLISLWDRGAVVMKYLGHTDVVRGLATLSSMEFLSCANDATVRRWNTATGECLARYQANCDDYFYSISVFPGTNNFVTSCEDSTFRVWHDGQNVQTVFLPAKSVWVALVLNNGDVATASSDGIIRIFTRDSDRMADPAQREQLSENVVAFLAAKEAEREKNQVAASIKLDDLPSLDDLMKTTGNAASKPQIVRDGNKAVVYIWSGEKWDYVGEYAGDASGIGGSTGGQKYDHVFDVTVDDGRSLKLNYNNSESPYEAAQRFAIENAIPTEQIPEIVNFILENAPNAGKPISSYADPFTGENRYVPGMSNVGMASGGEMADPLTGAGRYVPGMSNGNSQANAGLTDPITGGGRYVPAGFTGPTAKVNDPLCPMSDLIPMQTFVTFKTVDIARLKGVLVDYSYKVDDQLKVDLSGFLDALESNQKGRRIPVNRETIVEFGKALQWPAAFIVPVLNLFHVSVLLIPEVFEYFFNQVYSDSLGWLQQWMSTPNLDDRIAELLCRCCANVICVADASRNEVVADVASVVVKSLAQLLCSSRRSLHIAATGAIANAAKSLMKDRSTAGVVHRQKLLRGTLTALKDLESADITWSWVNVEPSALRFLLQTFAMLMWGSQDVVNVAQTAILGTTVNSFKDAVANEEDKHLARTVLKQLGVI